MLLFYCCRWPAGYHCRHPDSLLTRFYGLHRVSAPPGGNRKKVRGTDVEGRLCHNAIAALISTA